MAINYEEKKKKIEDIISCWQVKRLTLLGRVTVIKSLSFSTSLCFVLFANLQMTTLQQVNLLLFNFLWGSKNDKVKL